jgi:hypothetical protein
VRLDDGKFGKFSVRLDFGTSLHSSQTCPRRSGLANNHEQTQSCLQSAFIWRMSVKTEGCSILESFTLRCLLPHLLRSPPSQHRAVRLGSGIRFPFAQE